MRDTVARMNVPTDAPKTAAELLAMPVERRFMIFSQLAAATPPLTSPAIAAVVIATLAQDVRPTITRAFLQRFQYLISSADPLQVFVLASRFVNTATAAADRMDIHQYLAGMLQRMLGESGSKSGYVRRYAGEIFMGTLAHRTYPSADSAPQLDDGDLVVYEVGGIRPRQRERYGRQRYEVLMTRVETDSDVPLDVELGFALP